MPAHAPQRARCPPGFTQGVTNDVSAFATNFVTPRVQQASLTLEKEVAGHTTVALSLLNVRGEHLIRALDVNLPQPTAVTYPIFDSTGSIFQGGYYTVDSFATWQFTRSLTCPFPPCINPLGRPIAQLGAIDEFQSAASSYYNGATLSINRRVARGSYLRLSYTYAHAIDDGQDALVAGQPATVQNSYDPSAERGPSVTDQRQRLVAAFSVEPRPFHRGHELLGHVFNDWKISSIVNYGSGRPFNATVDRRSQPGRQRPQRPPSRLQPQRLHRPRLCHRRPSPGQNSALPRTLQTQPDRRILQPVQPRQPARHHHFERPGLVGKYFRPKLRHGEHRPLSRLLRVARQLH